MQFRTGSPYDDYLLAQAQRALGIAANERAVEGYWSKPQSTHDPDLIDLTTNKVRADLRQAVLDLLYGFWRERYNDPEAWSTVWIAGSALAYQWDRDDADLDILIGVDHAKFFEMNPAYRDTPEADMDRHFNEEFDRDLEPQTKPGMQEGPLNRWEITAYVNPRATDIREISPYAAYNLSADEWTVEPDMLDPEWDPRTHFSEDWWKALDGDVSTARMLVDSYHDAVSRYVSFKPSDPRASSTLAQVRYFAQRAAALFDDIHEGRKSSFTKGGLGYFGWGNLRWQTHKHFGTVKALRDIRALHKDAMAAAAKAVYGAVPEANPGRLAFDAASLANRAWIQRRLGQ